MDPKLIAAARALAAGDPLGALNGVALRNDASALALRGIAMAQLGDFARAKALLRRAARKFRPNDAVARAKCIVAEADVALASRDLGWPVKALEAARTTLEAHRDRTNAAYARYLEVKRLLLFGRIDDAGRMLAGLDPSSPFAPLRALRELTAAGIAIRRLDTKAARSALARARSAALRARIPALTAEVENAFLALKAPAARLIASGTERTLLLDEVERVLESRALVVDACRRVVRHAHRTISLARRPILFSLARALGEAWPADVPRELLLARVFGARYADESHRARLRVEVARLRAMLGAMAEVVATVRGFALAPRRARDVVVLAPPVEGELAAVLAFLADGESWSSSALAIALGMSQRTVQRALDSLAAAGKVQWLGRGRSRRWITAPMPQITTTLLLPTPLPSE